MGYLIFILVPIISIVTGIFVFWHLVKFVLAIHKDIKEGKV